MSLLPEPFYFKFYSVPSGFSSSSNPYSDLVYWNKKYVGSFRNKISTYTSDPTDTSGWSNIGVSPIGGTDFYLLTPDDYGNLWMCGYRYIHYINPDNRSTTFKYVNYSNYYHIDGTINGDIYIIGGYGYVDIIKTGHTPQQLKSFSGSPLSNILGVKADIDNNILAISKNTIVFYECTRRETEWEFAGSVSNNNGAGGTGIAYDLKNNHFYTFHESGGKVYARWGTFRDWKDNKNNLALLNTKVLPLTSNVERCLCRNSRFYLMTVDQKTYTTLDFEDFQEVKFEGGGKATNMRWGADFLTKEAPAFLAFNEGAGEPAEILIGDVVITDEQYHSDLLVCTDTNEPITLMVSNSGTAYDLTYSWSGPPEVSFNDTAVKLPTVSVSTPGVYEITCQVSSNDSSDSPKTATNTLTAKKCITEIGNITITGPNSVCKERAVGDYIASYDGDAVNVSYAWKSSDAGAQFTDPDKASTKVVFNTAGNHTVDCTITNLD